MANEVNALQLTAADADTIGWERCVSKTVLGTKFAVCFKIVTVGSQVRINMTLQVGALHREWTFDVDGNRSIEVSYGPVGGYLTISNWQISGGSISFTLDFNLQAFGIAIFSYTWEITLRLQTTAANAGGAHDLETLFTRIDSPESFLAFLKLMAAFESEEVEDDGSSANNVYPCYTGSDCNGERFSRVGSCKQCQQLGGRSIRAKNNICFNCQ